MNNSHYHDTNCLIALGSNLAIGEEMPDALLDRAFEGLVAQGFEVQARSGFFATPAFPEGSGPDYVNAAARIAGPGTDTGPDTGADPGADTGAGAAARVLAALHRVEADLARVRTQRWGARTVDLDLIGMGDLVLPDLATYLRWRDLPLAAQQRETPGELILPHPRLAERAFVLVPMMEVAPDWVHPVSARSIAQMHDALPAQARAAVRRL